MYVPKETARAIQEQSKARQVEAELELERMRAKRERHEWLASLSPEQQLGVGFLYLIAALGRSEKR